MDFESIIRDFARSRRVPVAAIRAATAEPDDFVEHAGALLQRVASGSSTDDEEKALTVLVHVLGEIGDERVLAPLLDVLSLPDGKAERLLGDVVTEKLPQILMRLGNSGAERLQQVIENKDVDEFVRNAAFDAWTYLVLSGRIGRDDARAYLADYPRRVNPLPGDYGWVSWSDSISALGFDDLRDAVAKIFVQGKAPSFVLGIPATALKNFNRSLDEALGDPDGWKSDRTFQPFEDTVDELSSWYGYSEASTREKRSPPPPAALTTVVNQYRNVGRNDPCPCGSGKKFKKCCLPSQH